jgi:hypothetical protein
MLKRFLSFDSWTMLVVFYLWGSQFTGKASAYIGLAVGALLLFGVRVLWNRWYLALTQPSDPLHRVSWALLVSLLYGIAEVIYGVLFLGYPLFTALQILVFNLCPVYLFLGIWVGFRHPGAIRTYIRFISWWIVIYAPLYFLFLRSIGYPGLRNVPSAGAAYAGAVSCSILAPDHSTHIVDASEPGAV